MFDQLLRVRSDRVIASGRLVISFFVLGAVWLDPSEPARMREVTYALLILYAAASALLFHAHRLGALSPRRPGPPAQLADLAIHILEMGLFGFLLYATSPVTGPYFPLFTFSIVAAAFRWGWKGALWTSVVVLVLLILSAAAHLDPARAEDLEIDRLLIRCAHVVVIGGMLTYFAFHRQRSEGELLRLGSWEPAPSDLTALPDYLASCARHAADVLAASRVVLVAQERDEPWATCVRTEGGAERRDRLAPADQEALAPEAGEMLLLGRCAAAEVLVLSPGGHAATVPTPESFRRLCAHLGADHLLSVPIRSDLVRGRLLVLDRPDFTVEEMMIASLVARQIEGGLGRLEALDALRRAAAVEERLSMARDLHDGVLQTLSAAAMHLEAIRRSPSGDRLRMAALQDWLHKEQRELRHMIERLRTEEAATEDPGEGTSLAEMAAGIGERWGIPVRLSCSPPGLRLGPGRRFQLQQILREAAANAVRHGGATRLDVTLTARSDRLDIAIADDGTGIGRHGSFDARECAALGIGPRNLRDRVAALAGGFRLRSGPGGLRLDISLPAEPTG